MILVSFRERDCKRFIRASLRAKISRKAAEAQREDRIRELNYAFSLVHQVSDWGSGAAAYFGWMREGPSRTGV
jgi:hypothetical protein